MSYCSLEEAKLFYSQNEIEVLMREETGELNTEAFFKSLKSAASEVDIYLGRRYRTPLFREYEVIPEIVKEWTCIIAVYKRSRELDRLTEEKRKRYEDVILVLKDIAKGIANLTDEGKLPAEDINNENGEGGGKFSAYLEGPKRVFTRKSMRCL